MEFWALEGFGVAYILQEMLTYKSDHIGTIIFGGRIPTPEDAPESFWLFVRELRSLALELNHFLVYEKTFQLLCKDYVDDIVVKSKTRVNHKEVPQLVFERLQKSKNTECHVGLDLVETGEPAETVVRLLEVVEQKIPAYLELIGEELVVVTLDKMLLMQAQENGAVLDEEELLFLAGEQANTFDADVDNQPVQDLALNEDNIFQADECDAFDSDVDDEPTAQSIFMANLSSVGSANPQAGPSNASILSEVHILENAIDYSVTNQDEHEIHNEVQQANVIDSTSVDMSCALPVLNDVYVFSDNDAFVPRDLITTELKIYKEQVAIYEQRAKFELIECEQRMDDQMRMLIQNHNKIEENLKKELHSVKLPLNSTMENNKIIEETVMILKLEFKQKESKFLTDFSNLKHLSDKLENNLPSQD
ncbi:retrovirus-related pol polyprotein from transposon TNT 1-94 [Tanacetum coccineum]